jgi:hypothetical protein
MTRFFLLEALRRGELDSYVSLARLSQQEELLELRRREVELRARQVELESREVDLKYDKFKWEARGQAPDWFDARPVPQPARAIVQHREERAAAPSPDNAPDVNHSTAPAPEFENIHTDTAATPTAGKVPAEPSRPHAPMDPEQSPKTPSGQSSGADDTERPAPGKIIPLQPSGCSPAPTHAGAHSG